MNIRVLFFAQAKVLTGVSNVVLTTAGDGSLGDIQQQVLQAYPALSPIFPQLLWAVNGQYCDSSCRLSENAEVACFPPVSGG